MTRGAGSGCPTAVAPHEEKVDVRAAEAIFCSQALLRGLPHEHNGSDEAIGCATHFVAILFVLTAMLSEENLLVKSGLAGDSTDGGAAGRGLLVAVGR